MMVFELLPLALAVGALCLSLSSARITRRTAKSLRESEYRLLLRALSERGHLVVSKSRWDSMLVTVSAWSSQNPSSSDVNEVRGVLQEALRKLTGSAAPVLDGLGLHDFAIDLVSQLISSAPVTVSQGSTLSSPEVRKPINLAR